MTNTASPRWIASLLLALGGLGALTFSLVQRPTSPSRTEAPDFTLRTLAGERVRLSELRGKVVFLNFWATWCPPCREEMPSMERLHRHFRNRGLAMLAVSVDDNAATVRSFVEAHGVTFPVALDPEARTPTLYGVTGYPETFIIDANGVLVRHVIGPENWDSPASIEFFERLLARQYAAGN